MKLHEAKKQVRELEEEASKSTVQMEKNKVLKSELDAVRHEEEWRALRFDFTDKARTARMKDWELQDAKSMIVRLRGKKEKAEGELDRQKEVARMWRGEVIGLRDKRDDLQCRLEVREENVDELHRLRRDVKWLRLEHQSVTAAKGSMQSSLIRAQSHEKSTRQRLAEMQNERWEFTKIVSDATG